MKKYLWILAAAFLLQACSKDEEEGHLYRSALKVAVTQMEILDEEFASLYDHSPIHHIEYRIKTLESISDKLRRRGYDVTIDNIYAYIHYDAHLQISL